MVERVWDKFLSVNDKASLRERPHLYYGFGERPALILVDLYRRVFGDRPLPLAESMKEWPLSCGLTAWEALPHIQRLLESARTASIPIVHVTIMNEPDDVEQWATQGRLRRPPPIMDPMAADRQRRGGDIVDEVAPQPGETVIRKVAPSAFWGTPLIAHLGAYKVDTVIVAGESTSGCVRATVVDARTYRLNVIVAEECVFDRHEAPHAINLFDMHQKYADVLALSEIVNELEQRTPPQFAGAKA
jgi:maleamate amidohydrolase